MKSHPLDKALALAHSDIQAGLFTGATSPDYWNMVGPFGGTTAAVMLEAVCRAPDRLGDPIAVKLVKVDLETAKIDFVLDESAKTRR